jgi:hypothetical protein
MLTGFGTTSADGLSCPGPDDGSNFAEPAAAETAADLDRFEELAITIT